MPLTKLQRASIDTATEFFFYDLQPGVDGIRQKLHELRDAIRSILRQQPDNTPLASLLGNPAQVLRDLEYGNKELTVAEVQQYVFLYYIWCLQYSYESLGLAPETSADFNLPNWLTNKFPSLDVDAALKNSPPASAWLNKTNSINFFKSLLDAHELHVLTVDFPAYIGRNSNPFVSPKVIVTDNIGATDFQGWEVKIPGQRIFTAQIIEAQSRQNDAKTEAMDADIAALLTSPEAQTVAPVLNLKVTIALQENNIDEIRRNFVPYPNYEDTHLAADARRAIQEERAPILAEELARGVLANFFRSLMLGHLEPVALDDSPYEEDPEDEEIYYEADEGEIVPDREELEEGEELEDGEVRLVAEEKYDGGVVHYQNSYRYVDDDDQLPMLIDDPLAPTTGVTEAVAVAVSIPIPAPVLPTVATPDGRFNYSKHKGLVLLTYQYYFDMAMQDPVLWTNEDPHTQMPFMPTLEYVTQLNDAAIKNLRSPAILELLQNAEPRYLVMFEGANLQPSTVSLLEENYYRQLALQDVTILLECLDKIDAKYVSCLKRPAVIHLLEKEILAPVLLPELMETAFLLSIPYYYQKLLNDGDFLDAILGIEKRERIILTNEMIILLLSKNFFDVPQARGLSAAEFDFYSHPLAVRQILSRGGVVRFTPAEIERANSKNNNTNIHRLFYGRKITAEQILFLTDRTVDTLEKFSDYADMMMKLTLPITNVPLCVWGYNLFRRLRNIYVGRPDELHTGVDTIPVIISQLALISEGEGIEFTALQTAVLSDLFRFICTELKRLQARLPWQSPPFMVLISALNKPFNGKCTFQESFMVIKQLAADAIASLPQLHPLFSLSLTTPPDNTRKFWGRLHRLGGFIPAEPIPQLTNADASSRRFSA